MKKILFLMSLMLFMAVPIFAQDVNPPTNWVDVIGNFNTWFATLGGIAALTVFVAAFITTIFKVSAKVWKQIIAWLVAVALVTAGNLLNIGFVADFPWITTIIYGLAAGLVANGLFDINTVQALLSLINLKKTKEPS